MITNLSLYGLNQKIDENQASISTALTGKLGTGAVIPATQISIADTGGVFANTNVETVLVELNNKVTSNAYSHPATHPATMITIADTSLYFESTNVEAVLVELLNKIPTIPTSFSADIIVSGTNNQVLTNALKTSYDGAVTASHAHGNKTEVLDLLSVSSGKLLISGVDFVTWDKLTGKPSSSVSNIDAAVNARHTHTNSTTLAALSTSGSDLLFGVDVVKTGSITWDEITGKPDISGSKPQAISFYIDDVLAVETKSVTFLAHTALTIQSVIMCVDTAPVGSNIIVDINKNGTTIFTTEANRPTITAGTDTSVSVVPDVVSIIAGDKISVDIDAVGSTTAGENLSITIVCA